MTSLPVEEIIPELLDALAEGRTAVIQAPPGSGKSTRIPAALLGAPWLDTQKIVMLEPRRLAAVNLACWISRQMGEEVGGTVGYAVRFDRKCSGRTRLEIVTEGLLTRRLQYDPFLESVGVVIFDEFHERTIHADTSLAFCLDLQQSVRPDLRIIIMSATIDTAKMKALLPTARIISSAGGLHPVDVRYLGKTDDDPARSAVQGVSVAMMEGEGDILVFLPGSGEIRRAQALLQERYSAGELLAVPLYGDLSFADQEKALLPAGRRKAVLATNIAETSLTIEGITAVVDSGLVRRARFDRSRAIDRLVTERISAASTAQRAGRAGRLRPGVCYRLWSRHEQGSLVPYDPPEILTADLCELSLNLALWGVSDPGQLAWIDRPPLAALDEAGRTLRLLGALDEGGRITPLGKSMVELPLHPRIARMMVAAVNGGCGPMGADLAAILSERDFIRTGRESAAATSSDLCDRLEMLIAARNGVDCFRETDRLDVAALRAVERLARQLKKIAGIRDAGYQPTLSTVSLLAATAFPDRIAAQREPGSRRYLLANGHGALLDQRSGLINAAYLVVTRLDGGDGGDGRIFAGSALDLDTVRSSFAGRIAIRRRSFWDKDTCRVLVREEEMLGAITLQSRAVKARADEVAAAVLEQLRTSGNCSLLRKTPAGEALQARVLFLRHIFPEDDWPDVSEEALLQRAAVWLPEAVTAMERPERFSGIDLDAAINGMLGWQKKQQLDHLAPTHLPAPSGSSIRLDYSGEERPVMAVKLQELFGLAETPKICGGRVPVLIHLLSPAGRPMQVTRDLRSFWNSTYPEVRKELKGRYPKHPWPDDPWNAAPTRFTKRRAG